MWGQKWGNVLNFNFFEYICMSKGGSVRVHQNNCLLRAGEEDKMDFQEAKQFCAKVTHCLKNLM